MLSLTSQSALNLELHQDSLTALAGVNVCVGEHKAEVEESQWNEMYSLTEDQYCSLQTFFSRIGGDQKQS